MTTTTLTVRGQKVSNRSQRRYLAVAVRPEPRETADGVYVAFAEILKRSDSLRTVRREQERYGFSRGAFAVVVDSLTGEEI